MEVTLAGEKGPVEAGTQETTAFHSGYVDLITHLIFPALLRNHEREELMDQHHSIADKVTTCHTGIPYLPWFVL